MCVEEVKGREGKARRGEVMQDVEISCWKVDSLRRKYGKTSTLERLSSGV